MSEKTVSNSKSQLKNNNLFDLLYYFPTGQNELKDYRTIDGMIRQIVLAIKRLQKSNIEQIQKICISNRKLQVISRLLLNQKMSTVALNLFTHLLLSVKLLNYLIKLNVPLIVYRNLVRLLGRSREQSLFTLRQKQVEESLKFMLEYSRIEPKRFPRSYAHLISIALSSETSEPRRGYGNFLTTPTFVNLLVDISIELSKNNLILAIESQTFQTLYDKTISCELELEKTKQIIDIIIFACSCPDTRSLIHNSIDLGKAFGYFNNVDNKGKKIREEGENDENLMKICVIIEKLLSSWSTLMFFITDKGTLMNFITGLPRKGSNQISMIKNYILKKIIHRALNYEKSRMQKSQNLLGLQSNYLNYRGLVLLNFLLKHNCLYETFEQINKEGQLLQSISHICLQYFPNIFQNEKYNRKIILNIKYPRHYEQFIAKEVYSKKHESYNEQALVSIKAFSSAPLIAYDLSLREIRNFLVEIKENLEIFDSLGEELKDQIDIVLEDAKQLCQNDPQKLQEINQRLSQGQNINFQESKKSDKKILSSKNERTNNQEKNNQALKALLASFYNVGVKIMQYLPWKAEYLKYAGFLSSILEYLITNQYEQILTILLRTMERMFKQPRKSFFRYLITTTLDDFGRYLVMHEEFQELLINHFQDEDYSFRISRILNSIDYEKTSQKYLGAQHRPDLMSAKKLLEFFCNESGSDYLLIQIIEIIKKHSQQNLQKYQQESGYLIEVISNNLLYHKNEEVAVASIQFFEETLSSKAPYLEKYVKGIKLERLRTEYLRKRTAYLFLIYEWGLGAVINCYPQLFKEQLECWFGHLSRGFDALRQYSNFIMKEARRYNNSLSSKQEEISNTYLFLGFEQHQRRNLLNLPWNIKINEEFYPALLEYKMLKEKLKLRVRVYTLIESQIEISLVNIGANSFGKLKKKSQLEKKLSGASNNTILTIRREEVVRSYEKFRNRQFKENQDSSPTRRFVVTKEQVTLYCRITEDNEFMLEKMNINVHLEKNIYRPLLYPLNLIQLLGRTRSGMEFLRKEKSLDSILQQLSQLKSSSSLANNDTNESTKQYLLFLGCYSCSKHVLPGDRIKIYSTTMQVYLQKNDLQIKQICHWVFNVLAKDEQVKKKMKEEKKWRIIETKYCQTLFFFNYYHHHESLKEFSGEAFNFLDFIRRQLPSFVSAKQQILGNHNCVQYTEFKYIYELLNNELKGSKEKNYKTSKKELKNQDFSNAKVFELLMRYMSLIRYGLEKVNGFFQLYREYLFSPKFENDFPGGFALT